MKRLLLIILLGVMVAPVGCVESDPFDETLYFTDIYADQVYLGDAQLLIPAYGEIYQTAFETVECVTAGTYYIVDGPTTSGELLGFENNGLGRLTYTDITENRICLVSTAVTISVPADDRPATISSKIHFNGVADDASFIGEYISDADPADALPVMCLLEFLSPGDYIEIYVASATANTTVVVNSMTMVATTVD